MKQQLCTKAAVGLVLGFCLLVAIGPGGQAPPKGSNQQLLPPPAGAPVGDAPATETPPPQNQGPASGYSAGQVGQAMFQIDKDTGSVIVLADDQTNEHIQKIIQSLDRPIPQVLIKVLFLEVTHSNDLDLGVEGSFFPGSDPKPAQYDATGKLIGPGALDQMGNPMAPGQIDRRDNLRSFFGLAAETRGGFYHILTDDADVTIRALAGVAKLEVLSRPSVLARNNEQALITVGESVPFITNSRITQLGDTLNTIQYQDIGIILQVTPHITAEGLVEMLVSPEISTLTGKTVPIQSGINAPVIAKRAAETRVIVPDGMTVVIGGLMKDDETEAVSKIPILGDIPWLGTLFRRTIKSKEKTELIIFLTPHVVAKMSGLKDLSVAEVAKTELAPATLSREELERYVDNWSQLAPSPKPVTKEGFWRRTSKQIASAFSIFR